MKTYILVLALAVAAQAGKLGNLVSKGQAKQKHNKWYPACRLDDEGNWRNKAIKGAKYLLDGSTIISTDTKGSQEAKWASTGNYCENACKLAGDGLSNEGPECFTCSEDGAACGDNDGTNDGVYAGADANCDRTCNHDSNLDYDEGILDSTACGNAAASTTWAQYTWATNTGACTCTTTTNVDATACQTACGGSAGTHDGNTACTCTSSSTTTNAVCNTSSACAGTDSASWVDDLTDNCSGLAADSTAITVEGTCTSLGVCTSHWGHCVNADDSPSWDGSATHPDSAVTDGVCGEDADCAQSCESTVCGNAGLDCPWIVNP